MPDTTTETVAVETPTTDVTVTAPPKGEQDKPADKPLGENGEKALKAERSRATAAEKERDALKAQLDKIAEANLSDLEKAQKEAAELRAAAESAQAEALRFRVAAKHAISDEDAELFLTGSDEATLERQAARLVERTPTSPRADLSQGGSGTPPALNSDGLEEALKSKLGI